MAHVVFTAIAIIVAAPVALVIADVVVTVAFWLLIGRKVRSHLKTNAGTAA